MINFPTVEEVIEICKSHFSRRHLRGHDDLHVKVNPHGEPIHVGIKLLPLQIQEESEVQIFIAETNIDLQMAMLLAAEERSK